MSGLERANCKWCGSDEGYAGTLECDRCWNIRNAMDGRIDIAKKIICSFADEQANKQIKELQAQLDKANKRIESSQSDSRKAIQILNDTEAQLAAAQAEITRLHSMASELASQENQFQEEELSRATMRFLCPVCRKAAASSDDANLCCAYDIPAESTKGGEEKAVIANEADARIAELEMKLAQAQNVAAAQAEIAKWREALDEAQANSGFWGRAAAKAKQEARRLAERCRLLEKHIWHDVRRVAKESGKFDDDAEVFANKAIELLNYAINEAISGEEKK